jgi:hypothetical protein
MATFVEDVAARSPGGLERPSAAPDIAGDESPMLAQDERAFQPFQTSDSRTVPWRYFMGSSIASSKYNRTRFRLLLTELHGRTHISGPPKTLAQAHGDGGRRNLRLFIAAAVCN